MAAKRALIVDDSRSARVILSRMLESYGLQVDAAETAEQAFEFLNHHQPDVIFMDHLMPGMDGFQAVQALKSNPATAMIPVMMYTSQEGELYVGQARALGAVGVLPKTVKHADVSRVLYQLNLLQERREGRSALFESASPEQPAALDVQVASARPDPVDAPPTSSAIEAALQPLLAKAFKEQQIELRRFMLASFEAFVRRVSADLKTVAPVSGATADPVAGLATSSEPPTATVRSAWVTAGIAVIALLPTIVLAAFYLRILDTTRTLTDNNSRLAQLVAEQQAQINALRDAPPDTVAASAPLAEIAQVETEPVGYGEAPLAGPRVEKLRVLLARLRSEAFRGVVRVESFVGDFCLSGNAVEGFSLAAEELPVARCDVTGNPFEDSLTGAQRQSLPFANLAASVAQETGGAIRVETVSSGRRPVNPYPPKAIGLTAGEWNRAAARNNRVEFAVEPAG